MMKKPVRYCAAVRHIMAIDYIAKAGDSRTDWLKKAFSAGYRVAAFNEEIYVATDAGVWIRTPLTLSMLEC